MEFICAEYTVLNGGEKKIRKELDKNAEIVYTV
jgi:hypothetical protein